MGKGGGEGGGAVYYLERRGWEKNPCIFNFKGRSMGMDVCAFTDERFF